MGDRIKGFVQIFIVTGFVALSLSVSNSLHIDRSPTRSNTGQERLLFVETQSVSPAPYRVSFSTTGTVQARAPIQLVPEISGRVVYVNANLFEGGTFNAGENLFQIDPRDFELAVERLEAEVARAQTALELEQAESAAALLEWSQLNGDKKVPPLVAREPQLAQAQAQLKAAQAQLKDAKLDLERTTFFLPFSGRVTSNNIEAGQYLAAGQSYGEVFDIQGLEVHASLPNDQLKWILNSTQIKVKVTAEFLGKTRHYDAFLKRSGASLDSQTRFAKVSFGLQEGFEDLLPGVFVTLHITGDALDNVTLIPSQALQKENLVWVVQQDNTLTSFEPDILHYNDNIIAVKGIDGPLQIVTSKLAGASEGMKIKTSMDKTPQEKDAQDE